MSLAEKVLLFYVYSLCESESAGDAGCPSESMSFGSFLFWGRSRLREIYINKTVGFCGRYQYLFEAVFVIF